MPLLSAFTPLGHLHLTGAPSHGERFHASILASAGKGDDESQDQYSFEEGSRMAGHAYAQAMQCATALYTMERGKDQAFPDTVYECLPKREREFGIFPSPFDTIQERRAVIAARRRLPLGCARNNVELGLTALLGDDFVAYIPTEYDDAAVWPADCDDQPMNLVLPNVRRSLIRLTSAISVNLGTEQPCSYQLVVPLANGVSPSAELREGDIVVVEPEDNARAERVTVVTSTIAWFSEVTYVLSFTAVFNNPHGVGAFATTSPWPMWSSTKRHNTVIVTAEAAVDREKRRKIDDFLGKVLRGVSTWSVIAENSPGSGSAGPFKVGVGQLGITPIGTIP